METENATKPRPSNLIQVNIRLPETAYLKLKKMAEEGDRTMAKQIERIIRRAAEEEGIEID